jgi:HEAT repeat protein
MDFSDPAHAAVVSTLMSTLRHGPADVRQRAFAQLADLGPVVLTPLLDLVMQADRQHLGWILDGIEWEDGEGQTGDSPFDLLTATRDEPFWYLAASTRLIERVGREASPALIMLLADSDPITRAWAACLLGHSGEPEAVSSLLMRLASADHRERTWVIDALGRIGDRCAVPQLIPFVVDDAADLQSVAALALGRIGDPRALAPLMTLLRQANASVYAASVALSQLGRAAVPALIAILEEPDIPKLTYDVALLTLGHYDDS